MIPCTFLRGGCSMYFLRLEAMSWVKLNGADRSARRRGTRNGEREELIVARDYKSPDE